MTATKQRFDRLRGLQMQRVGREAPAAEPARLDGAISPAVSAETALGREAAGLAAFMMSAHGYSQADIDELMAEAGPEGLRQLVREWRLSLVSADVDGQMPEGLARRARLEFDRAVRGLPVEEQELEWCAELVEVAVVRRSPR